MWELSEEAKIRNLALSIGDERWIYIVLNWSRFLMDLSLQFSDEQTTNTLSAKQGRKNEICRRVILSLSL
jgi:hypothetical protein